MRRLTSLRLVSDDDSLAQLGEFLPRVIPHAVDVKAISNRKNVYVGKPDAYGLKAIQHP